MHYALATYYELLIAMNLPTINEILDVPLVKGLITKLNRGEVVSTALLVLGELALQTKESALDMSLPTVTEVADRIADKLLQNEPARLVPTINATGRLFPPELGAAPLASQAINVMTDLAKDYAAMGRPVGKWDNAQLLRSVESLINKLAGAESVMPVNTATAGWFLILHALNKRSGQNPEFPVAISRGHLFELPSGSRITDILQESGCTMLEVGSVNQTTADDFNALPDNVRAFLYICSADDKESGRVQPSIADISKIAKLRKIPLIVDIGLYGLIGGKNTVSAASVLADGADVVIMRSGALFGGPACSVILGRKTIIDQCRTDLLANAVLCSPYTLAALEQTLLLYSQPDRGANSIPIEQILHFSEANLANRAQRIQKQIAVSDWVNEAKTEIVEQSTAANQWLSIKMPTCRIVIQPKGMTPAELSKRLTQGSPAVLGTAAEDVLTLDLRTVLPSQDIALVEAFIR